MTGDALTGYLRAVIEWQGVQMQAMQAQLDALQALQRAQQAQQALGANVAKMAKESGAAEGSRLALDGTWVPAADR